MYWYTGALGRSWTLTFSPATVFWRDLTSGKNTSVKKVISADLYSSVIIPEHQLFIWNAWHAMIAVLAVRIALAFSSPHFITFGTLRLCWECKETRAPLTLTSSLKPRSAHTHPRVSALLLVWNAKINTYIKTRLPRKCSALSWCFSVIFKKNLTILLDAMWHCSWELPSGQFWALLAGLTVSCLAWSLDSASNHESRKAVQGSLGLGNGWHRFPDECKDDVYTPESR